MKQFVIKTCLKFNIHSITATNPEVLSSQGIIQVCSPYVLQ